MGGNTPAIECPAPEECQHSFTLRGHQEAVLNSLQEKPWATKTGHTHWSDGRCSNVTMEVCIGCRNPHIRVDPPDGNSDQHRNTYCSPVKCGVETCSSTMAISGASKTERQLADKYGRKEKYRQIQPHRKSDLVDSANDAIYIFDVDSENGFRGTRAHTD